MTYIAQPSLSPAELNRVIKLHSRELAELRTYLANLEDRVTEIEKNIIGWTGLSYQNGWNNISGKPFGEFSKDHVNIVRLRGRIIGPEGVIAFTLPSGYRPSHEEGFSLVAKGRREPVPCQAVVSENGNFRINFETGREPEEISLGYMSYPAEN